MKLEENLFSLIVGETGMDIHGGEVGTSKERGHWVK